MMKMKLENNWWKAWLIKKIISKELQMEKLKFV